MLSDAVETVWKMAGGLSTVLLRLQEANELGLFAPLGRFQNPDSAPIPIFQTVSPCTPVNKRKKEGRSLSPPATPQAAAAPAE
jgi:hypothetical protein